MAEEPGRGRPLAERPGPHRHGLRVGGATYASNARCCCRHYRVWRLTQTSRGLLSGSKNCDA